MTLIGFKTGRSTRHDRYCSDILTTNIGLFGEAMWKKRHLIPLVRVRDIWEKTFSSRLEQQLYEFSITSFTCVALLARLHEQTLDRAPSLLSHIPHYILYAWTYTPQDDDTPSCMSLLRRIMEEQAAHVPDFIEAYINECHRGYSSHLAGKICRTFRNDTIFGEDALTMAKVCCPLICDQRVLQRQEHLPEGKGFIPSLLASCQRQMCGSLRDREGSVYCMFIVNVVCAARRLIAEQIQRYGGELNLIGVIATALVGSINEKHEETVNSALILLDMQASYVPRTRRNPDLAQQYTDCLTTSAHVWHDTLEALQGIETTGGAHLALKNRATDAWREHGLVFNLKEGKTASDQICKRPSIQPFWLSDKRCFLDACACSVIRPTHHVRVCKGCFRAMYCNVACQRRDWTAGHKLVCGQ
ncbi:hypothetical protein BXZ70DRAFT_363998 [Cristinia sonorae]|uniref:MYND-type domain-containing protein n=1 Tax=Cristinia sonorae TaxID=1940300 RepID=A0A8K0ULD6_9AGAR|nr:hypothetical protein BXZ70DRAFT_363998 [Cristinia sonorae]